jgi:hypothetical protein
LRRAMHTLSRILKPRSQSAAARRVLLVRSTPAQGASPASKARPRVIAAAAARTAHPRLHLAASHRATPAR